MPSVKAFQRHARRTRWSTWLRLMTKARRALEQVAAIPVGWERRPVNEEARAPLELVAVAG